MNHPLDGQYRITSTSSHKGDIEKRSDGETVQNYYPRWYRKPGTAAAAPRAGRSAATQWQYAMGLALLD